MTATYSPEDSKLRLYSSSRLDAETYARVKTAGFRWAPKQDLFVAPAWSPEREDLLLELCGEIGDEDTSLVDRAEERAERFEGYRENRERDAEQARAGVAAIADNIPLGQPILVGHHSERHARKDAERIENGMRRAVKMWDTARYWTDRAAGAIGHAKYKELPGVRHRRIKGLESEQRKVERSKAESELWLKLWTAPELTREQAIAIANRCHLTVIYSAPGTAGTWSAWDVLRSDEDRYKACPAWTVAQVQDVARHVYPRIIGRCERWLSHLANRLAYERAMLGESGGIAAAAFDLQVGGRALIGSEWLVIRRVNRKDGAVVSVTLAARYVPVRGVEEIKDYRPPTEEDAAKVKAATALAPLCNYPGAGFKHMTKAEYDATVPRWSDFPKIGRVDATETTGRHRVRQTRGEGKSAFFNYARVYLIDVKRVDPPANAPRPTLASEPDDAAAASAAERRQRSAERREQRKAEAAPFEAIRESLKAGVRAVCAPQLFPTPPDIAARMVELADVHPGDRVLEPSAGNGRILIALQKQLGREADITAVEIRAHLAEILRSAYRVPTYCADFLGLQWADGFDRIVMNPPFERGDDVRHIEHAITMLKPGGRLVALCANGPLQQERLRPQASEWIELEHDTFKSEGTGVRVALLVIEREA